MAHQGPANSRTTGLNVDSLFVRVAVLTVVMLWAVLIASIGVGASGLDGDWCASGVNTGVDGALIDQAFGLMSGRSCTFEDSGGSIEIVEAGSPIPWALLSLAGPIFALLLLRSGRDAPAA